MIRTLLHIGDAPARRGLIIFLALSATSALASAAIFLLIFPLVSALFSSTPADAVGVAAAMAALLIVVTACEWVATVVDQTTSARYITRMHSMIAERAAALPLGYFATERAGSIGQMVTKGVVFAANAPGSILRPMLQGLLVPLFVIVGTFSLQALMGCALAALAALIAVVYAVMLSRQRGHGQAVEDDNADAGARVLEFARVQPAVRAAGPDSLAVRLIRAAIVRQRTTSGHSEHAKTRLILTMNVAVYVALLVTFSLSLALVLGGIIDVPFFIATLMVTSLLGSFVLQSLPFGLGVELAKNTLRELSELMTAPLLDEPAQPRMPADASIRFENVVFGYEPSTPVLQGVSFEIAAGSTTAIVGPSGSGKSTIARLIARFADVDAGTVLLGGVDVREIGTRGVMPQISMVFQDVYLFEDTLRENIRLGCPGASDRDVEQAALRAGVNEIADRLPLGLDTPVGESGGTLSGGERQRVSIARALLKNAPIVLLDEATAALDIESEAYIQAGLSELAGRATLVVIAHRLQTIRAADQIVVLDGNGAVESVGRHEDLLVTSAMYAGFWSHRAESMEWHLDARD